MKEVGRCAGMGPLENGIEHVPVLFIYGYYMKKR